MAVTKSYDYLNRLSGITSTAGGSNVAVFNYANNTDGQIGFMKVNRVAKLMAVVCAMLFAAGTAQAFYNPSTGRWLSRDLLGEGDGPNIHAFLRNDGLNRIDLLGLEWIVERRSMSRAVAYVKCETTDTWDALAREVHMDTSDYKVWVQTNDETPIPGKKYTIPNTIYVDFGEQKFLDRVPTMVISTWRSEVKTDTEYWLNRGYRVSLNENSKDDKIITHLGRDDIYGFVYIGHGYNGGIINSYSSEGPDKSGIGPDRYTKYGIGFLNLYSCNSADRVPIVRRNYRLNAWESNVARRAWFMGYEGSVNTITDLSRWRIARGKNDQPFGL